MTHYSSNPGHVRGELFLPTGKWKYTIMIDMSACYDVHPIQEAIVKAVRRMFARDRGVVDSTVGPESDYVLFVQEPYHKYGHPIMIHLSAYDENDKYRARGSGDVPA